MPPRLERRQSTGDIHFVTFSCQDRNPYLASDKAKDIFEQALEQTRKKHDFKVLGYVVMPEHVHLLLTEPASLPLHAILRILKRSVSHQLPEKPFWLPRYYDFNIFTNDKQVEKLRYIHRNPVTRGLIQDPADYRWSSFRQYAFHEPGPVTITR